MWTDFHIFTVVLLKKCPKNFGVEMFLKGVNNVCCEVKSDVPLVSLPSKSIHVPTYELVHFCHFMISARFMINAINRL